MSGILRSKTHYQETEKEFQNQQLYEEWISKKKNSDSDSSQTLDDYFQQKYFKNRDYFKTKMEDDNPWDFSRKLYNKHMDEKEKASKDYVLFHPHTFKAYYEHKDELKYEGERHIFFKVLYDFKYLIISGFILFNIFIIGNLLIRQNQEKAEVEALSRVNQGKGIKTKLLPLNTT
jgi:hypothetical protein